MDSLNSLYTEKGSEYYSSLREDIKHLLPEKIERCLDVGCGTGETLLWLKNEKRCNWIAGIELNQEAACKAKSILDFFVQGNIETMELPFEHGSIDIILCLDVLEHLIDPWVVVKRLKQLLKPGGSLIASIPNVCNFSVLFPLLLRNRWDYTPSGMLDRTHLRFFTKETTIELLEQAGLMVDSVFPLIQDRRGSKIWYFNMLTFYAFTRFLTSHYLVRGTYPSDSIV